MGLEISLAGLVPPGNDTCIALDATASGLPDLFRGNPVMDVTVIEGGRIAKVNDIGVCTTFTTVKFKTGDVTAVLLVPESLATTDGGVDEWIRSVRSGLEHARDHIGADGSFFPEEASIAEGTGFSVRCASTDCLVLVTENDAWTFERDVGAPIAVVGVVGALAIGGALGAVAVKLHVLRHMREAFDRFTTLGVLRKSKAHQVLEAKQARAETTQSPSEP